MNNKLSYFQFVEELCKILDWPRKDGIVFVEDAAFQECWNNNISPRDAIRKCDESIFKYSEERSKRLNSIILEKRPKV